MYARNARGESKKVVLGNVAVNSKKGNNGEYNNKVLKFVNNFANFKYSVNH